MVVNLGGHQFLSQLFLWNFFYCFL